MNSIDVFLKLRWIIKVTPKDHKKESSENLFAEIIYLLVRHLQHENGKKSESQHFKLDSTNSKYKIKPEISNQSQDIPR